MTVTTITIDRSPGSRSIDYLPDFCLRCCSAGHFADRRDRLAALTEPTSITWYGGEHVTCRYRCDRCGLRWTRSDLWDATSAGFD